MKIILHEDETRDAQARAHQEKAAPRLYEVLKALRAESQGFQGFSPRTIALAHAALANAEGSVDGLAEETLKSIDARVTAYLAAHRAGGK